MHIFTLFFPNHWKKKKKEKENSFHPYINLSASSYKQFNALTLTKHLSPKAENINNG
jgi:hypothetical protein